MNAADYIKQNMDVERILNHYGFEHKGARGDLIRCACKMHDGSNPSGFVINTENSLWSCHTGSCGNGDLFTLIMKMEDCSFKESVEIAAKIFDLDIGDHEIKARRKDEELEYKRWASAVRARMMQELPAFLPIGDYKRVTKFRNYSIDTLRHFDLQLADKIPVETRDGKTFIMTNRLICPIIQNGILVGLSLRRVNNRDVPKWFHTPAHLQTRNILYNYDSAIGADEIVVVEGIFDTWAYHEIGVPAVCTFGAHLTDEQFKQLLRTGADIVLSYDGDEAGREATKKVYDKLKLVANVKYVPFADGEDPDNLPRKELWKRYESRRTIRFETQVDGGRG